MKRLSDKLLSIINKQDFCFAPEEMRTVEEAIARFSAYENTGLEPEEMLEYQVLCATYVEAGLDAKFVQACIDATKNGATVEDIHNLKKVNIPTICQ